MLKIGVETTGDGIIDWFSFKQRRDEPKVAPIRKLWDESNAPSLFKDYLKQKLAPEIKEEMSKPRRLAQISFGGYDGYQVSRERMRALGMTYPHISAYIAVEEVYERASNEKYGTEHGLIPRKLYGLILTQNWLFGSYKDRNFVQLARPERVASPQSLQILVDKHIRAERR